MNKKVAIIVANGFEDLEFSYSYYRLIEVGFAPVIIVKDSKEVTGKHGYNYKVDLDISNVFEKDYLGLVIPGGSIGASNLRKISEMIEMVKAFNNKKKPIAAICHGVWLLGDAGVINGRNMTGWPAIKQDIIDAGGKYYDEPVVVDKNLVPSRKPSDLPFFMQEFILILSG